MFTVAFAEKIGEPLLGLVAGAADQPQQEEERHHRGHEVGIGHLPGAAMVAAAGHDDALDDDGPLGLCHCSPD
jgi:hypothetical protein